MKAGNYPQYSGISDGELIRRIRDGETEAADFLMEKYKPLVRSKARSLYMLGAEPEDLIQEGMIGLYKALRDYDFQRENNFAAFASVCVERQLYTAIEASLRQKHAALNHAVSLNSYMAQTADPDRDDTMELHLALSDVGAENPEDVVISEQTVQFLCGQIEKQLSSFEKKVWNLYGQGYDYTKIAKELDCPLKSADNALQRIRRKSRHLLKEEYGFVARESVN